MASLAFLFRELTRAWDVPGEMVDSVGGCEDDRAGGGEGEADQTLAGDYQIGSASGVSFTMPRVPASDAAT